MGIGTIFRAAKAAGLEAPILSKGATAVKEFKQSTRIDIPHIPEVNDEIIKQSQVIGLDPDRTLQLINDIRTVRMYKRVGPDADSMSIPYLAPKKEAGDWETIARTMRLYAQDKWWDPGLRAADQMSEDTLNPAYTVGDVEIMTPDEYLELAYSSLEQNGLSDLITNPTQEELDMWTENLLYLVEKGFGTAIPALYGKSEGVDGIRTALAAKHLGLDEIPVRHFDVPDESVFESTSNLGGLPRPVVSELSPDDQQMYLLGQHIDAPPHTWPEGVKNIADALVYAETGVMLPKGFPPSQLKKLALDLIEGKPVGEVQDMANELVLAAEKSTPSSKYTGNVTNAMSLLKEQTGLPEHILNELSNKFDEKDIIDFADDIVDGQSPEFVANTILDLLDSPKSDFGYISPAHKALLVENDIDIGVVGDKIDKESFKAYTGVDYEAVKAMSYQSSDPFLQTSFVDDTAGLDAPSPGPSGSFTPGPAHPDFRIEIEDEFESMAFDFVRNFRGPEFDGRVERWRNSPQIPDKLYLSNPLPDEFWQAITESYRSMSPAEAGAINWYTRNGDEFMNSYLRFGTLRTARTGGITGEKINPELTRAAVEANIELLTNALEKIPAYTHGPVYRTVGSKVEEIAAMYTEGEITVEKAFTSYSMEKRSDSRINFYIESPKTAKSIRGLSEYDTEEEVLFKPGTRFFVEEKYKDGTGSYYIKLREVDDAE